MLWVSPQNDFHAIIDNMAWNWRDVPDDLVRFSISPHYNHRHEDASEITRHLWFEEHLKGAFRMPQTPRLTLTLASPEGVPRVEVMPDAAQFVRWSTAIPPIRTPSPASGATPAPSNQRRLEPPARCLDTAQPLFVHANVVYEMPAPQRDIPNASAPPATANSSSAPASSPPRPPPCRPPGSR
ncbi:MAG: hypothetical protein U1G05_18015 [Kiritimatiellia bacterium]